MYQPLIKFHPYPAIITQVFLSLSQDRESAAVAVRDIFSRGRRVRHEG